MTSDQIVLNDHELGRRIANAARAEYGDKSSCVARVKDGLLMGGAVFQAFTGESLSMHVAGFRRHWMTRDLLWIGYHYPFMQLGVKRVFGQVPEDNVSAQLLNLHMGWEYVGRIEGVYRDDVACLLMKLEKSRCRFLQWQPRGVKANRVVEEV